MRLLFLILCLPLILFSQKFSFIPYTTTQGLPQSQVTSIVQDRNNYLWIGTLGGLAKFNGGSFETFSSENGLLNNRVSCLSIIDDAIWIGHEGGVSNYKDNIFQPFSFPEDEKNTNVKSIIKFNGQVLIASHYGLYQIRNSKLVKISYPEDQDLKHIRSMVVFKNKLYIASMEGLYVMDENLHFSMLEAFKDINLSSIAIRKNQLFVTSYFDGAFEFDAVNMNVKKLNHDLKQSVLKGAFVDSYNNVWIHTYSGVVILDQSNEIEFIDDSRGLNYGVISSIFEDVEGSIWIGTQGKGVLRFPSREFSYFDKSLGLSSDLILTIQEDKNKNLWLGTFDNGIIYKENNKNYTLNEFPNNTIWSSVINVSNSNWFGTDYGLIELKKNKKNKVYYEVDGLPSDAITALKKIGNNEMLLGGVNAISVYNKGIFKLVSSSIGIGIVRDFQKVNELMYIGTSKGLYCKRGNNISKVKGIEKPVSCVEKISDDGLLIGTEEGLFLLKDGDISQINLSNLASANLINFINYKDSKVFIGTNNGLYIINDIYKNRVISHYGVGEGLVDIETNLNSSFFDSNDNYWFGTSSGLVKYEYKRQIVKSRGEPRIVLKSALLNYSEQELLKFCNSVSNDGVPNQLVLPFYKNNLAFEMDGISLSNYSNLLYQFKLEGIDSDWSPPSKNSLISFSGLLDNDYTLRMRAVNANGVYSNEIVIPFKINPPFYKKSWFIILGIVLIFLMVYIVFKYRITRELEFSQNQMLNYKSKLMALEHKSLNASMNRHFIFNALNSIQYFINSQDRKSANRYLTNFAKLIRKNLDATNEEGNMITLSEELEGLDLYLSLEEMRFKGKFSYEINCENIDTDEVFIPSMLLQPFIENAIIHGVLPNESEDGLITVEVKREQNNLLIQIQDNGVGINNSIKSKENDQGDHRSQGMEITAKRIDLIKKISNKGFEIIGPFQFGGIDSDILGTKVILKVPIENFEN